MKRALLTGISGQDGSYLAEHLLGLGYEVHGVVRRVALEDPDRRLARIAHLLGDVQLHAGNLQSCGSMWQVLSRGRFDECYHLAAQSFVAESFEDEFSTMETNVQGTHMLLAALKHLQPECRVYFAASSEMFGNSEVSSKNEASPFNPVSPYGLSKLCGYHLARLYRERHRLFVASGILFNHESPRRGMEFVTRRITYAAARIKLGLQQQLALGNLEARRDWGHARDYVRAIHAMLEQPDPSDFVVGTGVSHSVREFCDAAFSALGLDYRDYVTVDHSRERPVELVALCADSAKARAALGWEPTIGFRELVEEMVAADLALAAAARGQEGPVAN